MKSVWPSIAITVPSGMEMVTAILAGKHYKRFVGIIGDINRFSSAAKLAAYAGIDPTMRQSGEYNGVRNRMSKRGSPYLRHAIWLAASSAVLHDPALKLYFQKKRDEGKPYMASVGHACRKMVSIIYAVMRDNKAYTPYIPNEISA